MGFDDFLVTSKDAKQPRREGAQQPTGFFPEPYKPKDIVSLFTEYRGDRSLPRLSYDTQMGLLVLSMCAPIIVLVASYDLSVRQKKECNDYFNDHKSEILKIFDEKAKAGLGQSYSVQIDEDGICHFDSPREAAGATYESVPSL